MPGSSAGHFRRVGEDGQTVRMSRTTSIRLCSTSILLTKNGRRSPSSRYFRISATASLSKTAVHPLRRPVGLEGAEDGGGGDAAGFAAGEFPVPGNTPRTVRAASRAAVLKVPRGLLVVGIAPVVPTFKVEVQIQLAFLP